MSVPTMNWREHMGRVRFFCDCGKEMWVDMSREDKRRMTIIDAEEMCVCSDCMRKTRHISDETMVPGGPGNRPPA